MSWQRNPPGKSKTIDGYISSANASGASANDSRSSEPSAKPPATKSNITSIDKTQMYAICKEVCKEIQIFSSVLPVFNFQTYLRCSGGRYPVRPICPAAPVLNKWGRYASGSGDADMCEGGWLWDCICVRVWLRCTCFIHLHLVLQRNLYFFTFFHNDSDTR